MLYVTFDRGTSQEVAKNKLATVSDVEFLEFYKINDTARVRVPPGREAEIVATLRKLDGVCHVQREQEAPLESLLDDGGQHGHG